MARTNLTIRQDGTRVQLIVNGRLIADMPWDAADEVASAIYVQARKAEEIAKHELIVRDSAILLRVGAPLGLTSHPYLMREAAKEAQWNSALRRYLPGGIKSREQFGTPAIIKHPPRKRGKHGQG